MPEPPYYCVVFSSWRNDVDAEGYETTAARMMKLASQQPGYLGVESTRDANGFGITVSYWDSENAIRQWRENLEHLQAQENGRNKWYRSFNIRVCKVLRQQIGNE